MSICWMSLSWVSWRRVTAVKWKDLRWSFFNNAKLKWNGCPSNFFKAKSNVWEFKTFWQFVMPFTVFRQRSVGSHRVLGTKAQFCDGCDACDATSPLLFCCDDDCLNVAWFSDAGSLDEPCDAASRDEPCDAGWHWRTRTCYELYRTLFFVNRALSSTRWRNLSWV